MGVEDGINVSPEDAVLIKNKAEEQLVVDTSEGWQDVKANNTAVVHEVAAQENALFDAYEKVKTDGNTSGFTEGMEKNKTEVEDRYDAYGPRGAEYAAHSGQVEIRVGSLDTDALSNKVAEDIYPEGGKEQLRAASQIAKEVIDEKIEG